MYAVRFVGPTAYVVTFKQVDPLYTIDLADPARPRVLGELEMPGYSAYLHPIGERPAARGRGGRRRQGDRPARSSRSSTSPTSATRHGLRTRPSVRAGLRRSPTTTPSCSGRGRDSSSCRSSSASSATASSAGRDASSSVGSRTRAGRPPPLRSPGRSSIGNRVLTVSDGGVASNSLATLAPRAGRRSRSRSRAPCRGLYRAGPDIADHAEAAGSAPSPAAVTRRSAK